MKKHKRLVRLIVFLLFVCICVALYLAFCTQPPSPPPPPPPPVTTVPPIVTTAPPPSPTSTATFTATPSPTSTATASPTATRTPWPKPPTVTPTAVSPTNYCWYSCTYGVVFCYPRYQLSPCMVLTESKRR